MASLSFSYRFVRFGLLVIAVPRGTYNIGDDARQEEILLMLVRTLLEFPISYFMLFTNYRGS